MSGPKRDIVLLNAAAVLVAGNKAGDLSEGIALAAESIDTGKAQQKVEELVSLSNSFAKSPGREKTFS